MVESKGYWNGFVNGVPGDDSFHHLINILDFPMESFECDNNTDEVEDWEAQFQRLGPIPSEILQGLTPVLEVNTGNGIPGVRPNNLGVNDANSELNKLVDVEVSCDSSHAKFRTRSPSSVLESTGSCSAKTSKSTISERELLVPVRTRTKRPRPAVCKWHLIPPITPSKKTLNRKVTEKKKRKMPGPVDSGTTENSSDQHTVSKRCTHCQVSKTPQWREGPMGPKTLCNACGVRYRSGRLFPEYRPAASPTFVPSLHSNSHKKVIQMRSKSIQESPMPEKGPSMSTPPEFPPMESIHMKNESIDEYLMTEMGPAMSPPPEFVPMSSYLFDRM